MSLKALSNNDRSNKSRSDSDRVAGECAAIASDARQRRAPTRDETAAIAEKYPRKVASADARSL